MAKSSADDEELRRACEAAIEGTKQKIVLSIRVAKSQGIWGKSGKLGRHMAKPRVLALSSTPNPTPLSIIFTSFINFFSIDSIFFAAKSKGQRTKAFLRVLKYSNGGVLEVNNVYFYGDMSVLAFVIIVNIIYMSYPLRTKRSVGDQYVVLKKK